MKRWLVALAMVAIAASSASAAPPASSFQVAPCPDGVFDPALRVDCGFLSVPENRSVAGSRTIKMAVAIVRAQAARPKPDPIVFLDGGPSFGAIAPFAMDAYFAGASYVRDRDVILVDTRGEGLSQPRLGCPEFDQADRSTTYSKPFFSSSYSDDFTKAVRTCHDRLARAGIDLSAYNSAETAADLEALRMALGYRQWNLWAISADGVAGLTYMRLYPGSIRSAVLDSPQSTQMFWEIDYIRGATEMLERAFAGCAANAACNARYPNLRSVFYDLVHQLQAQPVQVPIPAFPGGPITVRVDGVFFYQDAINGVDPGNILNLFSEIWRSAYGGLKQVYQERFSGFDTRFNSDSFIARGKSMSYLCHDLIGFDTPSVLQQLATDIPEIAPYALNPDFGLPFGPSGCRLWDVGLADPGQHGAVASRIPTLVTGGEFDLGVPPLIVRQVPLTLPNSFYFEFPNTFHLQLASYNPVSPCARAIAAQFLDAPTRRPDSSCFAALPQLDYTP